MISLKSVIVSVILCLLLVQTAFSQERTLDIRNMMDPDQFRQSGLDKLSSEELDNLNRWLTGYTMEAMRYAYEYRRGPESPVGPPESPVVPLIRDVEALEGAVIIGGNGQFLGIISRSRSDPDSIANSYSPYGNDTSSTSIFNIGNIYGSRRSPYSAFNPGATSPPAVFVDGVFVAFLTANPFFYPRIDPYALISWIQLYQ